LKKRIVSGMRPTGKLHLGNLHGALDNWVKLQNQGDYDCHYFVADWHALTSDYSDTSLMRENITDMVIDWLSVGLDPDKSTLFVQSRIKEHAELFLLLTTITPLAWLERNPTYKEVKGELAEKDLATYGFLGYPVLQAADIIMYKAYGVPVGVDQLPHVELTREIARRFNYFYGEIFPLPETLLTVVPKLLGIDGRKMSKSYDNSIFLSDRGEQLRQKVASMFTDPQRQRKSDPGRPDLCNVFAFHGLYSPEYDVQQISAACRTAGIGCTDCKEKLAEKLAASLQPVHERQDYYRAHSGQVQEVLASGEAKARVIAANTMAEVREALKV
jgi:tryptophanyl-tRNA synthetase